MSRKSTLQRIAIAALAALALAGSAASTALADDRAIAPDPEPTPISIGGSSCHWKGTKTSDGFECKIGSTRFSCSKGHYSTWACGGCTSCGEPAREDEPALRALIEEVTTYLARIDGERVQIRR